MCVHLLLGGMISGYRFIEDTQYGTRSFTEEHHGTL